MTGHSGERYVWGIFACAALITRATSATREGPGPRVIVGHVYDAQHHGVARALVGVRRHTDMRRLLLASDAGSGTPWNAGIFICSASDGAFRLEVPAGWGAQADSALDVVAFVPNFAPYVAEIASGVSRANITLIAVPWHPYTITVQMPDGRPASNAVARAVVGVGDSVVFQAAADSAGRIHVRAPPMAPVPVVVISAPGYRPVATEPFQYGDTARARITVTLLPVMTGVVRDDRGRPKAGIGVFWYLNLGFAQTVEEWTSRIAQPYASTVTDSAGRYVMAPTARVDPEGKHVDVQGASGSKFDVMFADSGFTQIAFTQIGRASPGATTIATDVTLRRTRAVRIPVLEPRPTTTTGLGAQTFTVGIEPAPALHTWEHDTTSKWSVGIARVDYPDSGQMGGGGVRHEAVVRLPPGRYRAVAFRRPDVDAKGAWFDVPPGTDTVTMAEQRPTRLPIDAIFGRAAPELKATDLDGRPVHLADYRGKVVVLDVWGYWCGPCIHALKAHLIPFTDEHVGKPVVVLALHDASLRSRAEYDSVFGRRKRAEFNGRDLPFPILLDRPTPEQQAVALGERTEGDGETVAAYSVTGFPSTFIIDAHGILTERVDLIADAGPGQLWRAVDRLLGASTGADP